MQSGTFTYRNYKGVQRAIRATHVANGRAAAAALSELLQTTVEWRPWAT